MALSKTGGKPYLQWRKENKDEYNASYRLWRKNNPDKVKATQLRFKAKDEIRNLLIVVKARCKLKGIPFNLEHSDIVIPKFCKYLKVPLKTSLEKDYKYSFSIDRIDPNLGYVKGNVQIISQLANRMKSNSSEDELITFSKSVLELKGITCFQ